MVKYEVIDTIIEDLIKNGSDIPYVKELRDTSIDSVKKDRDLREVLKSITDDIEFLSSEFLEKENEFGTSLITGLSTGIYLRDENGDYKYTVIGGNQTRKDNTKVDFDTVFDVASITKLYTLLLAFKLEELGLLDLNAKVVDLNPEFKGLGDFALNDLIKLFGELRTEGNVAKASSYEEAYDIFKTLYLVSDDRTQVKYTDFGAMAIADTIEKVVSASLGKQMTYDEIMSKFLFEPLHLDSTMFRPKSDIASGNGYGGSLPHDPKSRALQGITGHAGIFTNSEDLMKLSEALFNKKAFNAEHLKRLSEKTFEGVPKGNLGMYLKHPDGYKITFNPPEFSRDSFTMQGWSGSIASFDLGNQIHNSLLVNAIEQDDKEKISNDKPKGFASTMEEYQIEVIKRVMLIYVIKKYYSKYCNLNEEIEVHKTI